MTGEVTTRRDPANDHGTLVWIDSVHRFADGRVEARPADPVDQAVTAEAVLGRERR